MTEDDLIAGPPREPVRTCCLHLSHKLWAALHKSTSIHNINTLSAVRVAVQEVQHAANTDVAAKTLLDPAVGALVLAIAGESGDPKTMERLHSIETLVGVLQASAIALSHSNKTTTRESDDDHVVHNSTDTTANVSVSKAIQSIAPLVGVSARQPTAAAVATDTLSTLLHSFLTRLPPEFFKAVIPSGTLSASQMRQLEEINDALYSEHAIRRQMLIERVRVTLQSFMWSPRLTMEEDVGDIGDDGDEDTANKKDTIEKEQRAGAGSRSSRAQTVMTESLAQLSSTPHVSLSDVFTSTLGELMEVTERVTSSGGERSRVKGVMIGEVPDRGGRTEGRRVPMPAWAERKVTPGGGRGGRGGGSNKRGRGNPHPPPKGKQQHPKK